MMPDFNRQARISGANAGWCSLLIQKLRLVLSRWRGVARALFMTANVHLLKGLVVVCCLWRIACSNAEAPIETAPGTARYSDEFRDHYPTRGRRFDLNRYQLEAPVVVWDVSHEQKITVLRTRGDKYGYEQQKCVMTIEGKGVKRPRFLSVLGFRNIETSWVTGKLALIKLDIGHVAGVDAIYDAEKDKLVYCESVHYAVEIEPTGLTNGSQPFPTETNRTPPAAGSSR
jgi:hypothetical protein